MKSDNGNSVWASIMAEELFRVGLKHACISPGSRSTPLALAFYAHPEIRVYSLVDERSAGFFGLGVGLSSGFPAALICTSGTAAGNYFPAVIEASRSHVPLLVITADRPPELRDSGANQTIDQVRLYGSYVKWFVDVALPEADPAPKTIRYLRTLACRAVARTRGLTPGPVHLNFPFRKPLEPPASQNGGVGETRVDSGGRGGQKPFTNITSGELEPLEAQLQFLEGVIRRTSRGLIVCGPRCPRGEFPEAVSRLAAITGFPLLADALSGVRFGPHVPESQRGEALICGGFETFLRVASENQWEQPELVLHFGAMPTSKFLIDYLGSLSQSRRIAVRRTDAWADEAYYTSDFLHVDPVITCNRLSQRLAQSPGLTSSSTEWAKKFALMETRTWEAVERAIEECYFEGAVLADVVDLAPEGAVLFVSNSLPVRHLDQFARPCQSKLQVIANRGASGIDGTISTAAGVANVAQRPLILVIGDLAFYHDLNGLLALKRFGGPVTVVLINNQGGGIFNRLPVADFNPPFQELFVAPTGLDFRQATGAFGLPHCRVKSRADFRDALRSSVHAKTPRVIEIQTDAVDSEKVRRQIVRMVVSK